MLMDAAVLATLTSVSLIFLYKKMPDRVKKWLKKHPLLVDSAAMLLTLGALGTTATALMAGAMVDVILGVAIYINNHREDFLFLFDFVEQAKGKLSELKNTLNEYNKRYVEEKGL